MYIWNTNHIDLILGASLPHVQVSPQRVEIHEGETLRLYCRAGGSPSPGLTWKKRGGSLPPQVRHLFLLFCFFPPFPSICTNSVRLCLWSCLGFDSLISFPVCLWVSLFCFVSSRALTSVQAIPSHGFHQFKSNSLDALQRRIDELQVCPSVWCLSHTNPSSMAHFAHLACCLLSACFNK